MTASPTASHGGFIEWAHTAFLLDAIELVKHVDTAAAVSKEMTNPVCSTNISSLWVPPPPPKRMRSKSTS